MGSQKMTPRIPIFGLAKDSIETIEHQGYIKMREGSPNAGVIEFNTTYHIDVQDEVEANNRSLDETLLLAKSKIIIY